MTIRHVPDSELQYYLISYDEHGNERHDDPEAASGRLSESLLAELEREPISDIFLMSHGWKGDIPAAVAQYDAWIAAMASCRPDRRRLRQLRPGFRPLFVGLHWPSLPWGDEQHDAGAVSFSPSASADALTRMVDEAGEHFADGDRARQALATIFAAALDDSAPARLPEDVARAYQILHHEIGLSPTGPAGAPGDDAEPFDPEASYLAALAADDICFASASLAPMLSPLRQLSFWKMKKRARRFGENGGARLLRHLQQADAGVRLHLMGHSFGCIVVSAMVAGAGADEALQRPVETVFLVQGALSLWSFAGAIPVAAGQPGYFYSILRDGKVAGPLLTTQSVYDSAVGKLYPLAARVAGQLSFAANELPRYGALGSFGARGSGIEVVDLEMLDCPTSYPFEAGKLYNLESSRVICEGDGLSGAHSDIAKPEVAHAFWQAVRVTIPAPALTQTMVVG